MTADNASRTPMLAKVEASPPLTATGYVSLLGALAFLPILLLLALPWVQFVDGSSTPSGASLLTDQVVEVQGSTEGFFSKIYVSGTVQIPAQWPVRLVPVIAVAGALLWWLQGWRGRLARIAVAVAGAFVTIWAMMVFSDGHFAVAPLSDPAHDSQLPRDLVAGLGAYATAVAFCVVGLVNLMLRSKPPGGGSWKLKRKLVGIHLLAIPVAFAVWGVVFVASLGGPLAIGAKDPGSGTNRAIPGAILYIDDRGCIQNVAASGLARTEVYCFPASPHPSGLPEYTEYKPIRTEDGTFGFLRPYGQLPRRFELVTIDAATGQATPTGRLGRLSWDVAEWREGPQVAPTGELAVDTHDYVGDYHTLRIVTLGSESGPRQETKVAELDKLFNLRGWSPDSQWILVQTHLDDEYWVFSRDGKTSREVATNTWFGTPTWWIDGLGSWPKLVEDGALSNPDLETTTAIASRSEANSAGAGGVP